MAADDKAPDQEQDEGRLLARFEWEGKKYEVDFGAFDFGERAEIEEHAGMPWTELFISGWLLSYKVLGYAMYLTVRRDKPDVELQDFARLTEDDYSVIQGSEEDEEEDRPTKGSEKSPAGSGAAS